MSKQTMCFSSVGQVSSSSISFAPVMSREVVKLATCGPSEAVVMLAAATLRAVLTLTNRSSFDSNLYFCNCVFSCELMPGWHFSMRALVAAFISGWPFLIRLELVNECVLVLVVLVFVQIHTHGMLHKDEMKHIQLHQLH